MSKKQMRAYNLFGKHISRFFMGHIAKKLGCKEKLDTSVSILLGETITESPADDLKAISEKLEV